MHIVQIYHSPVPVKLYGGMERVIESLCEGLLALGHKVTLICYTGDYKIKGVDFRPLDEFSNTEAIARWPELLPKNYDVLHFHVPMSQDDLDLPYVMTMHGNLQEHQSSKDLPKNSIFLTENHAKRHGGSNFVFNGLNPENIPLGPKKREPYFSFLGRSSLKRKGLHLAKQFAKQHKTLLKVGGGRGLSFFGTKYLGHLNNQQKYDLLGNSKAFLFPILWEEPFGLVLIEAMFCGTPIFALSRGSVPELLGGELENKAFLQASRLEELIQKSQTFSFDISPEDIRSYAEKRFSHIQMCEGYLSYYKKLI